MIKYTFNEITSCKMEICYYKNESEKTEIFKLLKNSECSYLDTTSYLKDPYHLLVLYQNDKIICYCILKINEDEDEDKTRNIEILYLSKCNDSYRCEYIKPCYILVIFIFDYFKIIKEKAHQRRQEHEVQLEINM